MFEKLARLSLGLTLVIGLAASTAPRAVSADDPEDRVLQLLEDQSTGGTVGLYLKEVNGAVLAANNESFVFEPASTIKALIHFHVMKQVQDGTMFNGQPVTLATQIPWFTDQTGSCPDLTGAASDTLEVGLTAMMQPSDNRWTQAMRDFFGDANIDATRATLGMNDTGLNHSPLGCGAAAVANPNELTLVDAGKLYEAVANGFLVPPTRDDAYAIMLSDGGRINAIIDQEAAGLALSAGALNDFKAARQSAIKAGSYTLDALEYRSDAGWAQLPFLDGNCDDDDRQFVFGVFINAATALSVDDIRTIGTELLREQIRSALESWDACADFEVVSKSDSPDPVSAGEQLTYTITIRNNGPSDASATVDDTLPPQLTFVSCNAPLGVCGGSGNARSATYANVAAGATRTLTLVATAKCNVADATVIVNSATVTSAKIDGDSSNDSASASTTVDNPAPTVDATLATTMLWPNNHDLVNVGLAATADDGACPAPATFQVLVFSNEDDETPNPPHSPDAKDIGLVDLRLRSERAGTGDGRVYLIIVRVSDGAGQTGFDAVTVFVPKSQSKKDKDAAAAQAAAAEAYADSHAGSPPAGYFTIGDGPVLGPKQ